MIRNYIKIAWRSLLKNQDTPITYMVGLISLSLLLCIIIPINGYAQKNNKNTLIIDSAVDYDLDENNEEDEHQNFISQNLNSGKDCQNLLRAVVANDLEGVRKYLITVTPNCMYFKDGEPRTPLVAAARNGNVAIGKLLIESGADVEFHAKGDESPLMAVSRSGSLLFTQLLLQHGAKVNKEVLGDGTALIYAVRANRYELAQALLEAGANPYQVVSGDEFAMFHARITENDSMIKLLESFVNK